MKAAVYDKLGSPDILRYDIVVDPLCAPDGFLVRMEAIANEGIAATLRRAAGDFERPESSAST